MLYSSAGEKQSVSGYTIAPGVLFPLLVGDLIEPVDVLRMSWHAVSEVYPGSIDAFAKMLDCQPPAEAKLLQIMRSISETNVKHALAQIIGEPFVPKDWGGERSDLYTNRLSIESVPISAAFLLKGPSVPGPMHVADLGSRGDQIARLIDEPAELLVLQHCNRVETAVLKIMRAFAVDPVRPRRYSIMDGASTYCILRAYDYIDGHGVFVPKAEVV